MQKIQFEAVWKLASNNSARQTTKMAMEDIYLNNVSVSEAAKKHNLNSTTLRRAVTRFSTTIRLVHVAVTGEDETGVMAE